MFINTKYYIFLLLAIISTCLSATELGNLSPQQLQEMQSLNPLIIDIRTTREWDDTGIIAGSHKLEFFNEDGKFDSEQWLAQLKQLKKSPDQPVVLVCRSGNRSAMVGNFLTQKQGMKKIFHLQNGIKSWIKAGKAIDKGCSTQVACK